MVKFFKRAWMLCLSLCLALGVCVAATACGETELTQVDYKVTVTCEDDPNLLILVSVQLLDKNGKAATEETKLKDGSATFTLTEGEYTVKLINSLIESGEYTYPTTTVTKAKPNATVAISPKSIIPDDDDKDKVEHRITVLYPDGTPVEGALVQLCNGDEHCDLPVETGADGVAVLKIDKGVHQIHIIDGIPDGYTFNNEEYETNENGGECTVYLEEISEEQSNNVGAVLPNDDNALPDDLKDILGEYFENLENDETEEEIPDDLKDVLGEYFENLI